MRTRISTELIDKYLRHECTKEEEEVILRWYASFDDAVNPVESMALKEQEDLRLKMLEKVRMKAGYANLPQKKKKSGAYTLSVALSAAALVFVVLLAGFYFFPGLRPFEKAVNASLSPKLVFTNTSQTLKRCVLPDGSSIWLKPSSTLHYLSQSGDKYREVSLDGECFFDVVHDVSRPFIVRTGELHTRVLGTSFNVKAYDSTIPAEVSVVSGKVLVYLPGKKAETVRGLVLLPKQKAVYSTASHTLAEEKVTEGDLKIWARKSVAFDNAPLPQVISVLNKKFNVDISANDEELQLYTLKADFSGQSLPVILEMISRSLDVNYQITGDNKIIINKN